MSQFVGHEKCMESHCLDNNVVDIVNYYHTPIDTYANWNWEPHHNWSAGSLPRHVIQSQSPPMTNVLITRVIIAIRAHTMAGTQIYK